MFRTVAFSRDLDCVYTTWLNQTASFSQDGAPPSTLYRRGSEALSPTSSATASVALHESNESAKQPDQMHRASETAERPEPIQPFPQVWSRTSAILGQEAIYLKPILMNSIDVSWRHMPAWQIMHNLMMFACSACPQEAHYGTITK